MSPENFIYWLQGFMELRKTLVDSGGATEETMRCIEDHLNLVLNKQTPVSVLKPTIQAPQPQSLEDLVDISGGHSYPPKSAWPDWILRNPGERKIFVC